MIFRTGVMMIFNKQDRQQNVILSAAKDLMRRRVPRSFAALRMTMPVSVVKVRHHAIDGEKAGHQGVMNHARTK